MGYSANAKIVVGVDFGCPDDGDDPPEWLMRHAPGWGDDGVDQGDLYEVPVDKLLDNNTFGERVELHAYGYTDMQHFILGIRVAWATDYQSEEIHPMELSERYKEWVTKVRDSLKTLGAPDDVRIGMYLCPAG